MYRKHCVGLGVAAVVIFPVLLHAQRKELAVAPLTSIEYSPTGTRFRTDTSGRMVPYSVDGRIDYEAATKSFTLSWIGINGTRQQVTFLPRDKVRPIVVAEVSYDPVSRMYTYRYTFANGVGAEQRLQSVYLEAAAPRGLQIPNADWYARRLTSYLSEQLSVVDGWAWSQVDGALGIAPGDTVHGFLLTSDRPPGVVKVFAEGLVPPLRSNEDLPEQLHAAIDRVAWRIPGGLTVGPVEVEDGAAPTAHLDRLDSLFAIAAAQGWIVQLSDLSMIRADIAEVRRAVAMGDSAAVQQRSTQLVSRLRGGVYPSVLSEARALIEFGLAPLLRGQGIDGGAGRF